MAKVDNGKLILSDNNLQKFILSLPKGLIYDNGKVVTPEGKTPAKYKFAINGVKYCLYEKNIETFDLDGLKKERSQLFVSGSNPERLKLIRNKISYFEYGYTES